MISELIESLSFMSAYGTAKKIIASVIKKYDITHNKHTASSLQKVL